MISIVINTNRRDGGIAPYRFCRQLLDGKLKSSDGALAVG